MKGLHIVLFTAAAVASPLLEVEQAASNEEHQVTLQLIKDTNEVSISAWNNERSALVGHSCSKVLATGAFQSHPISFEVDLNGAGNVTIGDRSYLVHGEPDKSGGISCGRIHSQVEALVNCHITLPTSRKLRSLNKRDIDQCFPVSTPDLDNLSCYLNFLLLSPLSLLLQEGLLPLAKF
ncbi:uncharacterized protein PG986_012827 [Apiospora aurea]|uniref:Superoxide dismutase copper/zinc binding domain-containing protein n=1 Tax=Apiospora aurea TaxID=335848 RepID=A0ABR1Q147_9PEZI